MIAFLRRVWGFVTPYRSRLLLGLLFGALLTTLKITLFAFVCATLMTPGVDDGDPTM